MGVKIEGWRGDGCPTEKGSHPVTGRLSHGPLFLRIGHEPVDAGRPTKSMLAGVLGIDVAVPFT
jgi:hypothetical protein